MRPHGLVAAAFLLAAPFAFGQAPHAHGVGRLDVALEGRQLTLELTAPLEDLLGFERNPASERERAAFDAAAAYLKSGQALVPSPAAGCRMAESRVEIEDRGQGHVELVARLAMDCAQPEALKQVEAALLGRYKKLKRLDARAATPRGQSAARLTPSKRAFAL